MENNLILTEEEGAILLLHMAAMRDSIKKGFKRNYGRFERKRLLNHYDEIKDMLAAKIEGNNTIDLELNQEQHDMLQSFLDFYTEALANNAALENIDVETNDTYKLINGIKLKIGEKILH